jgi:glycosyltransferase involved in cell wall biosynthesis
MKLIVQIPAFNEEKTLAQTLKDIPKRIDGITSIETLVIDDGSSDATAAIAKREGATYVLRLMTHRGLSAAFIAGIDAALRFGADIIVNTDADNQYQGADIAKLVAPILKGAAEVVIGDRGVASSPHMGPMKRSLQRLGSWTVSRASGLRVSDATSGFRAFSREAARQINVFNPFTYTLETIIQAGNRNLAVVSVPVRTNAPSRPSRLYRGTASYLRKSATTVFRVSTLYKPLKTFFALGMLLMLAGTAIGARFLYHYYGEGDRGHVQSLILAAIFLISGFQTLLIALVADLIAVNRRLTEEVLVRVRQTDKIAPAEVAARPRIEHRPSLPPRQNPRPPRRERDSRSATASPSPTPPAAPAAATQWVWLLDEEKAGERTAAPAGASAARSPVDNEDDDDKALEIEAPETGSAPSRSSTRRRRRRRGGARQHPELPGNRGKHLNEGGDGPSGDSGE